MDTGWLARNFSEATSDGTGLDFWRPWSVRLSRPCFHAFCCQSGRSKRSWEPRLLHRPLKTSPLLKQLSPAMKTTYAVCALVSALLVCSISAADPTKAATAPGIQERLTRIDLAVTLARYRKVRPLIEETSLQYTLEGDPASLGPCRFWGGLSIGRDAAQAGPRTG